MSDIKGFAINLEDLANKAESMGLESIGFNMSAKGYTVNMYVLEDDEIYVQRCFSGKVLEKCLKRCWNLLDLYSQYEFECEKVGVVFDASGLNLAIRSKCGFCLLLAFTPKKENLQDHVMTALKGLHSE